MLCETRLPRLPEADSSLDGVYSGLPRPDPDGFLDGRNEDFSVANTPGLGGATDRFDRFFDHVVAKHNLDFYLGEKIDHVLCAPIKFGMPLLPAEAFGLGDSDALEPDFLKRLLDLIEFERLDDRLDFFHRVSSPQFQGMRKRFGTAPWFSRSRAKGLLDLKALSNQWATPQYRVGSEYLGKASADKVSRLPIMPSTAALLKIRVMARH